MLMMMIIKVDDNDDNSDSFELQISVLKAFVNSS